MPTNFSPRQLQLAALDGFKRLSSYRAQRMMYLKQYVGQYYDQNKGVTGNEPVNLIFNTVRVITPNLVMNNPVNKICTPFIEQQDYAFILGKGVDQVEKKLQFTETLRAGIVSAFFAFGLFKTGIADSGQLLNIDDVHVDPGSPYCDLVDLDNLCIDPSCTDWNEAAFIGDRIRVPRQVLLDTDGYDHDLIAILPKSGSQQQGTTLSKYLSQKNNPMSHMDQAMDYVDVVELWVPSADATVTIPDPSYMITDEYLGIRDYYGPIEGPYDKLSLTLPVPNNPLPMAPISVWYDLHMMSNKLFKKTFEQADRQKDIVVYDPGNTDQAEDMRDAEDGEMVPGSPEAATVVSFGGQNQKNEAMLGQLQTWYNYVAGNPDQIAGMNSNADSATQATILQGNASIAMSDMKNIVYRCAAAIGRKMAWFLHYDPFLEVPITLRASGNEQKQIVLTPEQKRGDFLDFAFTIKPKSMNNLDPNVRAQRIEKFCANILPASINSAMMMQQMGMKFNLPKYLTVIADEMEIGDWVLDLFEDPEYDARMQRIMQMGPQDEGKADGGQQQKVQGINPAGMMQNGGSPLANKMPALGMQQMHTDAQLGANDSQSAMRGGI